ncbi:MAG: type 1 glutamine amidotransferase domain-containing protein, partial [Candidatus Magasanikbacteria bacterium]
SGYQDAEVIYPYYRLQEAGHKVDLIGPEADTDYQGKYGYTFSSDISAEQADGSDYEAVVVPGGWAPDAMRVKPEMVDLIQQAENSENTTIAAICHGPQLLVEADVVEGKRATAYRAVKVDLINAGAEFEDSEVVVDQNLITSRTPDDLPAFLDALLEQIQ